jgi:hypothetical protein
LRGGQFLAHYEFSAQKYSRLSASPQRHPAEAMGSLASWKSMDNAARTRQRVLAIFLPVTAVLYVGGEGLSPKGTDQASR